AMVKLTPGFRIGAARMSRTLTGSSDHVERLESPVQQLRICPLAEPSLLYGGVDAAEVGGEHRVVADIELGEAGRLAVLAALHLVAHHEHDVSRAVVGAEAGVFRRPAAEFREHQQGDVVRASDALE